VARPGRAQVPRVQASRNDGSERRIAPKAPRQVQGENPGSHLPDAGAQSASRLSHDLVPYLLGWRGYFGFCQPPRVLTNLEAWIRRRLRMYLWRQWSNGPNRFKELAAAASPSSTQRSPQARRRDSGVCQDTRRSNRPAEPRLRLLGLPGSMSPPSITQSNRPWYGTRYAPVVWEGRCRRHPPSRIYEPKRTFGSPFLNAPKRSSRKRLSSCFLGSVQRRTSVQSGRRDRTGPENSFRLASDTHRTSPCPQRSRRRPEVRLKTPLTCPYSAAPCLCCFAATSHKYSFNLSNYRYNRIVII